MRRKTYRSGKGGSVCSHCKRQGHTKETCWDLHLELKTKAKGTCKGKIRKIAGLDEEEDVEVLGFIELFALDVCMPCDYSSTMLPCCV